MPTHQIVQGQWEDFLSAFSAHNQTRSVTVDMESVELGPERLVHEAPLLAIEPDMEDGEQKMITVITGDAEGENPSALTHQVMNPKSIWLKEDDAGNPEVLDIEAEDGRIIIQFD